MITAIAMHDSFVSKAKKEVDRLNDEITKLIASKEYIISKIDEYKDELKKSNFPYSRVAEATSKIGFISIKNPVLKTYLTTLVIVNKGINSYEAQKKSAVKKASLTLKEYKFVVLNFNKTIVDKILYGYILRLGMIGNIFIINKVNKIVKTPEGEILTKKRIDWGATTALKKSILARGGTLYKETTHEDGSKTNNGGEKYIVHSSNAFDTWIYWEKLRCHCPKSNLYSFVPASGPECFMRILPKLLKSNPLHYKKFLNKGEGSSDEIVIKLHNENCV